jgi:hypothetical protein
MRHHLADVVTALARPEEKPRPPAHVRLSVREVDPVLVTVESAVGGRPDASCAPLDRGRQLADEKCALVAEEGSRIDRDRCVLGRRSYSIRILFHGMPFLDWAPKPLLRRMSASSIGTGAVFVYLVMD